MKISKFGVITLLLFGMVIGLTGIMCADQPVPAVPETQTLGTVTTADVVGIAMETDAGAWTLTNSGETMYTVTATSTSDVVKILNDDEIAQLLAAGGSVILVPGSDRTASISVPESLLNQLLVGSSWQTWAYILAIAVSDGGYVLTTAPGGIHNGVLSPAQIQYTTAYDANIVAQAGHTVLTKSMNINTGNKVLTQSNLKAQTGLTYIATSDGGNVVGSENLMIDGAGNTTKASDRMLCPFSSQPVDVIPAYCNIIQTGNTYDLTVGSVTSTMSERFVSSDATNPVQLDQVFNVKPYGTTERAIPAMGATSAYIKAHFQEARNYNNITVVVLPDGSPGATFAIPGTPLKSEDLTYSETSSAQGTILAFTKVIAYQSGKSLL